MNNFGRIEISPNVITDIVLESVSEVDGVVGISDKTSKVEGINILKNLTKLGNVKFVDVELGETECVIDLGIVVEFGKNIVQVVANFQEVVKKNVEKLTNIKVNEVNVKVTNIVKTVKEEEGNV
ncbi:Asp23/Gls24 family envelope stress response protein [Streptobacillus felis]|uniref:Asp23/Gls24 family envelope stress response protein n=1 Tax=Streptobacillus felis TaxID=1384509 RepID=A0A7Z0PFD9_9FUSO|nr:Asp23/Gls24 family envelope stress response protein [Streptobacillus felis]NYV28197.1 Asp23/Gls24 family envelope stress response protein [Streptobacillus felis]